MQPSTPSSHDKMAFLKVLRRFLQRLILSLLWIREMTWLISAETRCIYEESGTSSLLVTLQLTVILSWVFSSRLMLQSIVHLRRVLYDVSNMV